MTQDEYEAALARIEALMKLDPPALTREWHELDELVDRVEEYERVHYPMPDEDDDGQR